ncbi:hypothetical protein [Phenylobacterium sp.]|uniref:hypothetical protein n=1 Tax=Phenylobacterium sp. TaxID=1871053 RepID=UPI002F94CB84
MRAVAILAAVALAPGASHALDLTGRVAVGAQAGSTGPGVESLLKLNDRLVLRGAIEGFRAGGRVHSGGAAYDVDARWLTDSGMVDFHPAGTAWLVSVGAYYGRRDFKLRGASPGVVAVHGRARLAPVAPFAALGWDNTFHGARRIGFKVRVGVIASGSPDVDLRASGGGSADDAELARQERALRRELRPARLWPVAQAGLTYRF